MTEFIGSKGNSVAIERNYLWLFAASMSSISIRPDVLAERTCM